jgi:hypothetical protein
MSNKNDTHRDGTFVTTFFQAIDASMKHAITIIALLSTAVAAHHRAAAGAAPVRARRL